jgi:hypothetical protein
MTRFIILTTAVFFACAMKSVEGVKRSEQVAMAIDTPLGALRGAGKKVVAMSSAVDEINFSYCHSACETYKLIPDMFTGKIAELATESSEKMAASQAVIDALDRTHGIKAASPTVLHRGCDFVMRHS